jgi:hypothetical protein
MRAAAGTTARVHLGRLAAVALLAGCGNIFGSEDHVTADIGEGRVVCEGVVPQECLLVRFGGDADYQMLYDEIEGFQPEVGYRYRLRLSRHRVADPLPDGPGVRYRLVHVESKERSPRYDAVREAYAQRDVWRAARPARYAVVVDRVCFCPPETRGPVQVNVAAGGVAEVDQAEDRFYLADGSRVPAERWHLFPTVDGLFSVIVRAAVLDVHVLEVDYDDVAGYPRRVYIDPSAAVADDEVTYRVLQLTQL